MEPFAVVGSNRWTDDRDPLDGDETLVELRKGDAIICLGSVYYGQASNKTDKASVLLRAFSTPGYRRQEENQYLAVPWEVAEKYPTEVQEVSGLLCQSSSWRSRGTHGTFGFP
ncbi:hypothetical protein BHE90_007576 [Fusarium euwallaceae]|uniref:Uncharacterized protein n=1 Tax=Fusarium euwallaceae TaxID=1147111 RepID=A0A430LQF3_9HYPO|nr:hypothetical protein BHE90_007576 [Fusarium euwallaceae]